MIKLKIERRKASDKNMKFDRTAPSAMRPFKKNASTPTKVIYQLILMCFQTTSAHDRNQKFFAARLGGNRAKSPLQPRMPSR